MTVTDNKSFTYPHDKEPVTQGVTDNELGTYRHDKLSVTANHYALASRAFEYSDYCGKCYKVISPNQPISLTRVTAKASNSKNGTVLTTVCLECFGITEYNQKKSIVRSCAVCSREIHYDIDMDGGRRYHRGLELCSLKCAWTLRNKKTAKKRLEIVNPSVACEVCSTEFTPSRTDSRYCSSKCRQKAYRQRSKINR